MNIKELFTPFDDINIKTYLEKNGIENPNEYLKPTKDSFEKWYEDEKFMTALEWLKEGDDDTI